MQYTERFSEYAALLATLPPLAGALNRETARVDLANYRRAAVIILAGNIATSIDVHLHQHNAAVGGTSKNITGKIITQLGAADDNKAVCIELRVEELDVDGDFHWVSALVDQAAGADISAVAILGLDPRFEEVDTTNWEEIVD